MWLTFTVYTNVMINWFLIELKLYILGLHLQYLYYFASVYAPNPYNLTSNYSEEKIKIILLICIHYMPRI